MANAILAEFYRFEANGIHNDIVYPFEPSAQLRDVLASLTEDQRLYFELSPNGGFLGKAVKGSPPGWRVHIGGIPVYVLIESEPLAPQAALNLATNIHAQLLSMRLYQCKHDDILEYWAKPDDDLNRAEDYASTATLSRSVYLANLIRTHCSSVTSALEVGCNIGRNLNYLHEHLGMEVAGLEISAHALHLLKSTYPSIAGSTLYEGDAAVRIGEISDGRYDVVFSMAVLMHIHPDAPSSLWENIVRVAGHRIVTIENESLGSDRNWVRNYEEVFAPLGATQIHTELPPDDLVEFNGYVTRVFAVSR